ncbi:hypothetical protein M378DRAFT_869876 [Amanita muscaria Koide BX008]|uniref:Uncharacterized protein n=1 Tax=Amanita muscaria (strain Koide BX008) TaxID=946122 RepID=A0A0C2WXG5_AMAMK|nr:hypothetical protein M378DRAFT_869876 [Amanita muscaria Koide BX008]
MPEIGMLGSGILSCIIFASSAAKGPYLNANDPRDEKPQGYQTALRLCMYNILLINAYWCLVSQSQPRLRVAYHPFTDPPSFLVVLYKLPKSSPTDFPSSVKQLNYRSRVGRILRPILVKPPPISFPRSLPHYGG